jgi:hypothetical protein
LVTCLGETLPLHHPFAWNIHQERMEMIQALDDAMFEKIVEYDIRLPNSRYAQSIAVALKDDESIAQWRMNEAHYALILHERLLDASFLQFFDSATMLSLKYPFKHSAIRFCQQPGDYLADHIVLDVCGHLEGGHGYDPFIDNVPIDDLFVGKSQAGEHAG